QAKSSNQLDARSTTSRRRANQVTFAFSTLKRMGETEYPSSLSYLAEELYTNLKTLRRDYWKTAVVKSSP
ncbi:unnamed protein product, partial [Musa textilis]